jgi:hypothetical protein
LREPKARCMRPVNIAKALKITTTTAMLVATPRLRRGGSRDRMSEASFEFIEKKHVAGGVVLLRYGSSKDDPLPFILTLMPEHVAGKPASPSPQSAPVIWTPTSSRSLVS